MNKNREPNFEKLNKPSIKDQMKVGAIHEQIEQLIHTTDLHEDFIEFLLYPFEVFLTKNGVNLNETDY